MNIIFLSESESFYTFSQGKSNELVLVGFWNKSNRTVHFPTKTGLLSYCHEGKIITIPEYFE